MADIVRTYGSASTAADTPLGRLRVWATSDGHVGISTRDSRDGDDVAETVTVQRVAYRVSLHLYSAAHHAERAAERERQTYGWQERPVPELLEAFGWSPGFGYSPLTRDDWPDRGHREMHGSTSANVKTREVLTRWAAGWLETADGRALLEAGRAQGVAAQRERLEREAGELRVKLAELEARLEVLS